MRKLLFAKDENGNLISINSAKLHKKYFCPFCNKNVIPKKGKAKSWHFAHIKQDFKIKKNKKNKKTKHNNNLLLSAFKSETKKEIASSTPLTSCIICKATIYKKHGIKISENKFICKECLPKLKEYLKKGKIIL